MSGSEPTRGFFGTTLALGTAVLVAAGCEIPEEEAPPPMDDRPAEQPVPDEPPAQPAFVPLEPVGDSGVSGEATVIKEADEVVVLIEVAGLPEEGEYAAHIHEGSCEEGGPVHVGLNPVAGMADGTGASTTTLDREELNGDEPVDGFVQVHALDGAPIACGDIDHPAPEMGVY